MPRLPALSTPQKAHKYIKSSKITRTERTHSDPSPQAHAAPFHLAPLTAPMCATAFHKGEEVLYLDRRSGRQLPAVVEAVDFTLSPPGYCVHIPSLGTSRETEASRLQHLGNEVSARGTGLAGRAAGWPPPSTQPGCAACACAGAACATRRSTRQRLDGREKSRPGQGSVGPLVPPSSCPHSFPRLAQRPPRVLMRPLPPAGGHRLGPAARPWCHRLPAHP